MALYISPSVRTKLSNKIPPVTEEEIVQCFANRESTFLEDQREDHKSDPATLWFISETDYGRVLKIAFIPKDGVIIRTAYDPNETEIKIYKKYSQPL